jgi:hypothetical protein
VIELCYIASIVEGHGEVEALPALLHRIAEAIGFEGQLRVNPPIRVKSGSFLNDQEYFKRQVSLAAAKAAQVEGNVLILLDCEDHCPAELGPNLLQRAQEVRPDVEMYVALAYREYETWFVTAVRSLRGLRGIAAAVEPPGNPVGIRNAKGWLSKRMNVAYDPITHQLEFTRAFDLVEARANLSFDRFFRGIENMLDDGAV